MREERIGYVTWCVRVTVTQVNKFPRAYHDGVEGAEMLIFLRLFVLPGNLVDGLNLRKQRPEILTREPKADGVRRHTQIDSEFQISIRATIDLDRIGMSR